MTTCLLIYNPNSGKNKFNSKLNYIISQLKTIYDCVDFEITKYKGHATEISKSSCGKYSHIIICGGDGTVNEVINGIAEQPNQPIIGYIPSGTINDISKSLNIPKKLTRAIKVLKANQIFEHDIFKVNNTYGIYACGIGAFTFTSWSTSQKSKHFWGKLAYFFHGIGEISRLSNFNIKITHNNITTNYNNCIIMLIINSRSTAGFLLNHSANLSDGKVDVVLVKRGNNKISTLLSTIFNISKIFLFDYKHLKDNKYITKFSIDNFHLQNNQRNIVNIDGEQGPYGNIDFNVINKGIKIITPRKTIQKQLQKEKNKNQI